MIDYENNLDVAASIAPAANRTATTNGTGVDLANCNGATVVFQYGVVTDGTWTPTIEESDDNSTFAAATDVTATVAAIGTTTDDTAYVIGYVGKKRYIRAVVTETTASTTGALFSAVVIKHGPRKQPQ